MAKVGVIGASGYTGAELLRLCAAHPELEVVVGDRRHPGRHRRRRPVPEPAPARTPTSPSPRTSSARVDGLDLVFLRAAPRCVPGDRARAARSGRRSRRPRADFRLTDPAAVPAVVRRGAHRPRAPRRLRLRPARAVTATRSRRRRRRRPGCYPTAAAWPSPRWCGPASSRPTGIIVDAASGVSGPGGAKLPRLLHGRRGLRRLRAARPPAHAGDRAGSSAARCCSRPHLAPMNRGILATCYARPARRDVDRRRCSASSTTPTPTSRSSSSSTARRRPRPTLGSNTRPRDRALRRAHRLGRRPLRHRQPR